MTYLIEGEAAPLGQKGKSERSIFSKKTTGEHKWQRVGPLSKKHWVSKLHASVLHEFEDSMLDALVEDQKPIYLEWLGM